MPKKAKTPKSVVEPVSVPPVEKKEVIVAPPPVKAAVPAVPAPPVKQKTEADKIWDEMKDVQLNMFALPDQTVAKYCRPITVEPTKLYVTLTASSALVALEEAFSKKFEIVPAGRFIIISRK